MENILITTSQKVIIAIEEQGRKKNWLAEKLGISRVTLDERLKDNCWLTGELIKLKDLGIIKT